MTTMSASLAASPASAGEQGRRHRPAVEIDAGQPGRRRVEARIDIVRAGFGAARPRCRAGRSARSRPMVTLVLPEPERGAPMMMRACRSGLDGAARQLLRAARRCRRSTIRAGETKSSRAAPPRPACRASRPPCARRGSGRVLDRPRPACRSAQPAGQQVGDRRGQVRQAHIDDDRLAGAGERRPVAVVVGAGRMAGGEDDRLVDAAHRRRDAGTASPPKAEVTPGRTRNGILRAASASASSPPRPKI